MNQAVVSHACHLARMLNRGLILLYIEDKRFHLPPVNEIEKTLLQIEAAHPTYTLHMSLSKPTPKKSSMPSQPSSTVLSPSQG